VSRVGGAGAVRPGAVCGGCELVRARRHLEAAVAELSAARQAWGVWADGVRQLAEQRLGVTDLTDQRVIDDPGYARALDMGAVYAEAVRAAEVALNGGGSGDGGRAGFGESRCCPCAAVVERK
jgi:hypothetical protein